MGNSNILGISYPCFTLGVDNKKDRDVLHSVLRYGHRKCVLPLVTPVQRHCAERRMSRV